MFMPVKSTCTHQTRPPLLGGGSTSLNPRDSAGERRRTRSEFSPGSEK
jgi:hypothetical protein